jgi:light-regulated signal transduction histidine kinase (bacteriophytochrome)
MVDEMLKLARLGRQGLAVKVTGLNSLVEDVITLLAPETEGRQVEWKIGQLPFAECDPILNGMSPMGLHVRTYMMLSRLYGRAEIRTVLM